MIWLSSFLEFLIILLRPAVCSCSFSAAWYGQVTNHICNNTSLSTTIHRTESIAMNTSCQNGMRSIRAWCTSAWMHFPWKGAGPRHDIYRHQHTCVHWKWLGQGCRRHSISVLQPGEPTSGLVMSRGLPMARAAHLPLDLSSHPQI